MGYFDGLDLGSAFKALQPPEPKAPGLIGSAVDTSLSVARGAVQGTKMLSDAFGAGNPVSDTLQRGIDWLSNNFSDHSKWEQLTSAQDQRAAALSGETWEELKAAARSFGKRPVDFLAEAAGTSLPTIAAAFLPGGQGAVLGRVAMMSVGAAQGAGAVKGQIFQTVEEAWKQAGVAPEEARERAAAAQEYFGSNGGQIALGTALGALAGGTGVEAGVLGARAGVGPAASAAAAAPAEGIMARLAARTPQFVKGGLKESLPEGAQGGQEQLASNLAMQNEGFATPTMQGVAGNAALEALAGGAFGAAASPLHRQQSRVSTSDQGMRELATATNADEAINAALKAADVPLTGGLSAEQEARALTALDAQAKTDLDDVRNAGRAMTLEQQRASGAPPAPAPAPMPEPTLTDMPFADRVLVVREQVADAAVREQVRAAFGPDALREVLRAASVADRPDINMPEATRERLLQLAEHILSRAQLRPLDAGVRGPTATREPAGPGLQAPSSVPRIALDTEPTGTIRVNSMGSAAPEVRADAISTKQRVDAMRRRPDGFEQQVQGRPLPRDFTLVGEGALTPGALPAREPAQLQAPPGKPGKRGAFEAAEAERAAAEAAKGDQLEAVAAVRRASQANAPTALANAMRTALDQRAHEAATSPTNDRPEPTQAQKEAGNYAKGHIRVAGLDLSIENPAGSKRSGVDADGKPWQNQLAHHYGYIRRTTGADGEHVDAFVKPGTPENYSGPVFVIDQVDPATGRFDEHKAVIGAADRAEAEAIYRANYASDWKGLKAIKGMTMPAFKKWLAGDTTKPVGTTKDRVDTMRKPPAPPPADPNALPTEKLAELVQLTGRDRGEVARQYAGVVRKQGRAKADEMLERALQVARARPKTAPAPEPAPASKPAKNEGAVAQPTESAPVEQPAPPAPSPVAAAPAPQPQPEPEGKAAAATEAAAPGSRKEPWQMSRAEWEGAREATRPEVAQSNFTRASGSQAAAQLREVERLTFGVSKEASERLRAAAKNGERIPAAELDALMERVNTRVSHRDVVEKAVRDGLPVPAEVLAEYPDLESDAAPAAPPKEESAATTGSADEVADESGAERVALPGDRPADLIALRKRESILKKLRACLAEKR